MEAWKLYRDNDINLGNKYAILTHCLLLLPLFLSSAKAEPERSARSSEVRFDSLLARN